MAYFADPVTGAPIEIFGRGGARATALQLGTPFLGEVPIDIALRQACDAGRPLAAMDAGGSTGRAFAEIARQVRAAIGL